MKLSEAMREVWENDVAWLTKENILQWLTLLLCGFVVASPFVFTVWFGFVYLPETPWAVQLPISFVSAIWGIFWFRVFGKWWPF